MNQTMEAGDKISMLKGNYESVLQENEQAIDDMK
jgi:hypothetical protein